MNRFALATILALCLPGATLAQAMYDVQFAPGTSGATLAGSITGRDYADYKLRASAGQTMVAHLDVTGTDGDGIAFFNILPPGSEGEAIWIGNMEIDQTAELELPEDGSYTLRVYLMGNDSDTGKTTEFDLHVSIE